MKPIAYCHTCEATYYVNNAPNQTGPTAIYGPRSLKAHEGHDVRPVTEVK